MSSLVLTKEDEQAVKDILLKFINRVATYGDNRRPEEIAILPAVLSALFEHSEELKWSSSPNNEKCEVTYWGEPSPLAKALMADKDVTVSL